MPQNAHGAIKGGVLGREDTRAGHHDRGAEAVGVEAPEEGALVEALAVSAAVAERCEDVQEGPGEGHGEPPGETEARMERRWGAGIHTADD
ncbi:MAG: hypothetical protein JWP68_2721 [Modestobacter sp.]|nr:hypothetical protein [Modestobacter sp.]